jgi:hypothetical protein
VAPAAITVMLVAVALPLAAAVDACTVTLSPVRSALAATVAVPDRIVVALEMR